MRLHEDSCESVFSPLQALEHELFSRNAHGGQENLEKRWRELEGAQARQTSEHAFSVFLSSYR